MAFENIDPPVIGFTGSQKGMSDNQKMELRKLLRNYDAIEFHHGDCIGADSEAHKIAAEEFYAITIHPPINESKRAFCKADGPNDIELSPKEYISRNHDIVDSCDVLIAAPSTDNEILRSGTWATVRYAKRQGKQVIILER